MFDFFDMANSYEERVVANTVIDKTTIDTCAITDSDQPYETGIQSPEYNCGNWVIVEMYDSKEDAEKGHQRWVDTFNADILPHELKDVSTCSIKKLLDSLSS